MTRVYLLSLIVIVFFNACTTKYTNFDFTNSNLSQAKWQDVDGFFDDNLTQALEVFILSCKNSKKYKTLKDICQLAQNSHDAKSFFISNFTPFKLHNKNNKDEGLATGYFEPTLNASLEKTSTYKYPIYSTPNDLLIVDLSKIYPELSKYRLRGRIDGNKVVPYYSRAQIESQEMENLPVIAYTDNKIDLFFLHIQGSGILRFEDNSTINVGYDNQNGYKYFAIGSKLVEIGALHKQDVSLQSIKEWLEANPEHIDEVLNTNDSFVFFSISQKSASGALGVELVPKRHIAVDPRYIPLGFPVFINTIHPSNKEPINSLVIAGDTGGAIKGEIRADYFWGASDDDMINAGKMKERLKMYILIPNSLL